MPDLANNPIGFHGYAPNLPHNEESGPTEAMPAPTGTKRSNHSRSSEGRSSKRAKGNGTNWNNAPGMSASMQGPGHGGPSYGFGIPSGMPQSNPELYNPFSSQQMTSQASSEMISHPGDMMTHMTPEAALQASQKEAHHANSVGANDSKQSRDSETDPTKPRPGTKEHDQIKKDNHKDVERRRREVINEGINELAKLVPGPDKNKGAILNRCCHFIRDLLREKEAGFKASSLEQVVVEQALAQVQHSHQQLLHRFEDLKDENDRLVGEVDELKARLSAKDEPVAEDSAAGNEAEAPVEEAAGEEAAAEGPADEEVIPEIPEGEEDA